jgi:hypothetical protein
LEKIKKLRPSRIEIWFLGHSWSHQYLLLRSRRLPEKMDVKQQGVNKNDIPIRNNGIGGG